jgi:apolipoprotein N-acyltransferase
LSFLLADTSGACLALSFPRFGHPAFGWIALVPLLIALTGWSGRAGSLPGQPPLRALLLGLTTGVVYFVGTVYWTGTVVATFGGLSTPLAVFGMALLAVYLGLYPALTAVAVAHLVRVGGLRGLAVVPAAWVATEYARGSWLLGGFPWVPLGNSQVTVLPVAQLASIAGVYGLSLLVAFVNTAMTCALLTGGRRRAAWAATAIGVPLTIAAWGTWRIADNALAEEGAVQRVGLVQANIAQEDKWQARAARRIFTTHISLTRQLARQGATFVIWPESSLPFRFNDDAEGKAMLTALARELGITMLFGTDELINGTTSYNSAFLLRPDGTTGAVYRKMHLVPFGEYIPMTGWLRFFPPLVETVGGFAPFAAGDSVVMLPIGDHVASTAICYEVVFPWLVSAAVHRGSELLTTITNDGWYGNSSAPFQHFELAAMRAIEQGRYLARAANTGISGFVDPYGRVIQRSGIFEEAALVADVRLIRRRTIYSAVGDVAAYASLAATFAAVLLMRRRH